MDGEAGSGKAQQLCIAFSNTACPTSSRHPNYLPPALSPAAAQSMHQHHLLHTFPTESHPWLLTSPAAAQRVHQHHLLHTFPARAPAE